MSNAVKTFEATAPNGYKFRFNASKIPAAVRFLECPREWMYEGEENNCGDTAYIFSTHRTVKAAGTSFQASNWRPLLRPDSVVTDIREV